jgi:PAS domain S-box-containing protein
MDRKPTYEELEQKVRELDKRSFERMQAKEALRASEEKYRNLVESTLDWVWTCDLEGRCTFSNRAVVDLLGYEIHEVVGVPVFALMQIEDRQSAQKLLKEAIKYKKGWKGTVLRWQHKDGSVRFLETKAQPILDEKGNLTGFSGIDRDITDRRQKEEALRKNAKQYRIIASTSMDGFAITDLTGCILDVNEAYSRMIGYSRDELLRMSVADIEVMHTPEMIQAQHQKMTTVGSDRFESRHRCKDGRLIDVEISMTFFPPSGQVLIFLRDITEIKLAQEEKAKIHKQLQQAQKMEAIGTLASGIAHDFNNTLGAIIGYAGMMERFDVPEDSPMKAKLKEVLKAANRAKDLVQQILTFCRQAELERKPVQLNYIVKDALKFLRASLPTTIEIRQDIASEDIIALADPTQIYQILMNLCTNAGHTMLETGGRLRVALSALNLDAQSAKRFPELKPGPHLKLTVSDTGHGMTSEVIERIFDPFFTTKKPGEGTGMGLAVVHGIVKSHEGVITVDSELGKGSIFQILLPRIEIETIESATETAPSMPTGKERILFIDDEQSLVRLVQEMLGRLGYDVVSKTSSSEALELFRSQPESFDLVITDQTMPHMTGIELAQKMLRIRSDILVILCTGYSEAATPEGTEAAGIREIIFKPLEPSGLARTVRKVLDSRIDDC